MYPARVPPLGPPFQQTLQNPNLATDKTRLPTPPHLGVTRSPGTPRSRATSDTNGRARHHPTPACDHALPQKRTAPAPRPPPAPPAPTPRQHIRTHGAVQQAAPGTYRRPACSATRQLNTRTPTFPEPSAPSGPCNPRFRPGLRLPPQMFGDAKRTQSHAPFPCHSSLTKPHTPHTPQTTDPKNHPERKTVRHYVACSAYNPAPRDTVVPHGTCPPPGLN